MKKVLSLVLFLAFNMAFSQKDLHFFYSDTIMEIDHMRCELKVGMAYGEDLFKAHLLLTNFTDSFKVINPSNIQLKISNGKTYALTNKGLFVIPPKGTEKFRIRFQGANFKEAKLELLIADIQTSGSPINFYNFGAFKLNEEFIRSQKEKNVPHKVMGPLDVYIKSFGYRASNGELTARIGVHYNGSNFLGFFLNNIKAKDAKGVVYINKRMNAHYYKAEKKEVNIPVLFDVKNPEGDKQLSDEISIDNVFAEYYLTTNKQVYTITMHKNGEGKGNPKNNDEKTDDIEVIED